ncbi:hemerythrin domain-containing protein [Alicyclobacillus fastidiosus]|uniref:Hemerythrin domain-containing protein n=1 Tax=Alicyclobacillus fastidiosus TaxID=392011 RepID=A0ABV5AKE7_9BACL|nr:hemerythrin domain-containing protein [Alicyclobacillus fastidiosus]WEH08461.1 hemerythrin domain-containing protein [Alicyclobacillus fastidiosus]
MTGLQRHEALKNLSRHHHHALVLAMNLNRAHDPNDTLKQQVIEFWEQGGNQHFREEEEVLLPIYAKYKILQDDKNVIRMLLEHVQIRMLVQRIKTDEANIHVFHELGSILKSHVHLEEQVVFSEIQNTVPEPDLYAIQHFFHEML